MTVNRRKCLIALTLCLCLCTLLLCGSALAEMGKYSINIEDFDNVMTYCQRTELSAMGGTETNSSGTGATENTDVTIRIVPSAGCSVDSIAYSYTDNGLTQQVQCSLSTDASGAVTTSFVMPPADVTVTIAMSREGEEVYEVEGSFLLCTGTISGVTETDGGLYAEPGSTLTVIATPEEGYSIGSMTYMTYNDPSPKKIEFTVDKNGTATGTMTMPKDRVSFDVRGGLYFINNSESGASQDPQYLTDYQSITNSSAKWYDINAEKGGWYVARGNVNLSKDTTLRVTGDVHLILMDGAKLTVGDGVYIKKGSSLSIYGQSQGTGKLVARPENGPGIGGMADTVGGSLYVYGGVIEAEGGTNAAGIGGGNHNSGYEKIVIYGGKVTAKGGSSGAGIGKGQQNSPSDCGPIEIYGGEVIASSTQYGAGIGGGEDRDGGTIRIYGGKVTATGGHDGAGIGGGEDGSGGNILIAGGNVTATGGDNGAGIGGGEGVGIMGIDTKPGGGTIVIEGGIVHSTGGIEGAGIGGGSKGSSGSITIKGGTVEAYANEVAEGGGAAIGGGRFGAVDSILIAGGSVKATSNFSQISSAAIGSGASCDNAKGTITITDGTVEASARYGAAIGSGGNSDFKGTIEIAGGTVTATSLQAGIGAGTTSNFKGTVRITGGNVTATCNASNSGGAGIGAGDEEGQYNGGGECDGTIEITGGTVVAATSAAESEAIGHGSYGDEEGTLRLSDNMRVTASNNSDGSDAALRTFSTRSTGCRNAYAKIEPCTEHKASEAYVITGETHAARCGYCNGLMNAEKHEYVNGICTVCGYMGTMVKIHYLPGNTRALGEMSEEACLPNSPYILANCLFEYSGYEFAGWRLGDTDTVLPAGTEYRFDSETTLTATWRNNWSDLQAAINAAESGAVIQLDGHTAASRYDSVLTVPADKSITLDLNGCTLDRGMTNSRTNGQVILNNGSLTITDSRSGGVITGGYGASGSDGGAIVNNGTLTLAGGTISGNRAEDSAGAVLNGKGATFTMTGGSIEGNSSGGGGGGAVVNYGTMNFSGGAITGNVSGANGGGIWSNGTLNLSGGFITENTAKDKGAGIYAHGDGTLTLSGFLEIVDNSSTQRGTNNLHINRDSNKLPVITAGAFAEKSRIGVSCSVLPVEGTPVAIISGVTGEIPQIVRDSNKYMLSYSSGDSKLNLALAPTYTVTASEDIEHGTVTSDLSSCNEGDIGTITVTPDENFTLASLTMTTEDGKVKTILPDGATGEYHFTMPAGNVTVSASFVQDKTSAAVHLAWEESGNEDGSGPDSVYVTLLDLEEPVCSVKVTAAAGWTATRTGLPMDHKGELASYTWTIDDSNLPAGYSLTGSTVDGELTTLTLTPAQAVTIAQSKNGAVEAGKREAAEGETVTLRVTPDPGYRLHALTCTAGTEGLSLTFDEQTDTYAFVMPAQAVTVNADFEKIPTEWELLQALIDAAQEGDTITLTQDYTGQSEDVSLHIVSGQKVTLNLNGYDVDGRNSTVRIFTVNGGELTIEGSGTIRGGKAGNSVGGAFIVKDGGRLTLNGGTLSDNTAVNGGGAVAVTNGTFTMNGGEISQNSTAGTGGGVIMQGGTFIMNDGVIWTNTADGNGGGLWVGDRSTVRITGGSIENNAAKLGRDVYLNGVGMSISGTPVIGQAYVYNTVITVDGLLDQNALIGLTCSGSAAENGTVLTSGLSGKGVLANFTSVKNGYAVALNDGGEVVLGTARTVILDLNDGSTETRKIRVADGTALEEPEKPVREGYVFRGWQLNGEEYDFETPVTVDITLTAQWMEIPPFGIPDFTLPGGVTAIEKNAFEGAAMTVVWIPDRCESIGDYAFRGCLSLKQICIPIGCELGKGVFDGCKQVYVYGTAGSSAESYCNEPEHGNCIFVRME